MAEPATSMVHSARPRPDPRFAEYAVSHEECLDRRSFGALGKPGGLTPFELQPWPALVDEAAVAEMERVSVGLCRLIKAIPDRVFYRDAEEIARHYDFPGTDPVRSMLSRPDGIEDAVARGDFAWTEDGLQCLEMNLASHLGGWGSTRWADRYLAVPVIRRFAVEHGIDLDCRDTVRMLFEHIVVTAQRDGRSTGGELNLAVLVPSELEAGVAEEVLEMLEPACRAVLSARGLTGTVGLHRAGELRERDGRVIAGGRTIHAVAEAHEGSTPTAVFRCFKEGTVQLYNGTVRQLLSDKRNLALLSELATTGLFTADEERLIEDHLPWTRRLVPGDTVREGRTVSLAEHAVEAREELVLKDARFASSGKGRGVHVGAETDDAEWRALLRRALGDGGWIVQERVRSLPMLFQHGERGCAPHEVVWGLFVFGDRYAGGFLSLRPHDGPAVVNTVLGASGGVIFETSPASGGAR